jgi:DnaJ domain
MHLPGRLSISTLGDLLGSLHRERTTGLLELREIRGPYGQGVAGRVHRVHLRSGLVAGVDTAISVPPLGEILRREGLAPREAVRRLVACIEAGDRRAAGEILEGSGLLSAEAIRAGLRAQLRERLDALFAVEDAAIGFHTARPLPHALRAEPLAPADFLHGRPRARDAHARRRAEAAAEPPPRSTVRPTRDDPRDGARRLLGVPLSAGVGDVRRAFRRMASVLHPDRLATAAPDEQQRHAARFAELSAAYHLLVA